MKKLYINQKMFTIGDKYAIYDENKQVAYNVRRLLFTLGRKYEIYNHKEQLVARIEQKLMRFMPQFDLYINNELAATVTKKFTFFYSKYHINSKYGDFEINGSFFNWNFEVSKNGKTICTVSKNFNFFRDSYELTIMNDVDEIMALSLVVIIDAIHHDSSNKS